MESFLSATKLLAFQSCPYQYHIGQSKQKIKIMEDGARAHTAIEKFLKGEPITTTQQAIIEAIFTDQFCSSLLNIPEPDEEGIELNLVYNINEFTITGKIDKFVRKGTMGIITDWKTGKKYYWSDGAAESIQGKIYAAWAMLEKGCTEVFFEIGMTGYGKAVSCKYEPDDLSRIMSDIQYLINDFRDCHESGVFPARAGSNCQYCDFIKVCKNNAVNRVSQVNEIMTDKELEAAINQIECTEVYIQKLREYVEAYGLNKGKVDGKEWNLYVQSKPSWRMSGSKAAQKWLSEKFTSLLRPDTTEAKELILKDEALLNEAKLAKVITDDSKSEVKWVRK